MTSTTANFFQRVPAWIKFQREVRLAPILDGNVQLNEGLGYLENLTRRFREGVRAPIRVAFFGPTGAGKSKLFCSLIGRIVSTSDFKRPCTRQAFYYLHEHWRVLEPTLDGIVTLHSDDRFQRWIFIDTPDFDSVVVENQHEAERVFREADAYLFVTDGLKYADASTWEYLQRIQRSRKSNLVLLNKVDSNSIAQDFLARFKATFSESVSPPPVLVVPEFPIDDSTLIPAKEPSIGELDGFLAGWLSDDEDGQFHLTRIHDDLESLFKVCRSGQEIIRRMNGTLGQATRRIESRFQEATSQLSLKSTTQIDPAIKSEVYRRVQERLEKIDLLRYPRRLIAMPIQGLRSLAARWLPAKSSENKTNLDGAVANLAATHSFQLLESLSVKFFDSVWEDIRGIPALSRLFTYDAARELRLSHDDLLRQYEVRYQEFFDWAADEARSAAAELSGQNKIKFIASQIIFNTVLIGAQIHTGGAFTVLEIGFDGVVSPMAAKAIAMVISSDKVREFEQCVHGRHQEILTEILDGAKQRVELFLAAQASGMSDLESHFTDILAFQEATGEIVSNFTKNQSHHDSSVMKQ